MNETQDLFPLIYFQRLLENDVSEKLINNFISDFVQNSGYNPHEIDKLKGIIKYYGPQVDEDGNHTSIDEITYDFYNFFQNVIEIEIQKSKQLFNSIIHHLVYKNQSSDEFVLLQKKILTNLKSKADNFYSEYPFISNKLNDLISFLENFDSSNFKKWTDSYSWDFINETDRINLISKLYNLLKDYKIIDSSHGEFINAFTNGEVTNGIKWLIKGKNTSTNKFSIFYFIDQLQSEGYIEDINPNDYNKKIEYVFRDKDGKGLQNIRQSKSDFLKGSYSYIYIDEILSQL